MPKVVIVGAGITGLCTAWALIKRGWRVEVYEAGAIPNSDAASFDHHRLIRSHYTDPGYAARMPQAFAAWDRVWADLGRTHYEPRGMIGLSNTDGDWTDRTRASFDILGVPHTVLTPQQIAQRYPMFETENLRYGLLTSDGGALFAERILRDLFRWLSKRGVAFHPRTPVLKLSQDQGWIETGQGRVAADAVVLAAGVGTLSLMPELAEKLEPRRCTTVYLQPPERLRAAWSNAPCWVDLGGEDDLWGMPPMQGWPLKIGYGLHTRAGDPMCERPSTDHDTQTIMAAYRGRFREIETYIPVETVTNFYVMAQDARFLLTRRGNIFALSADSGHGFKFGALTGEDVAQAVMGGDVAAIADRMAGLSMTQAAH